MEIKNIILPAFLVFFLFWGVVPVLATTNNIHDNENQLNALIERFSANVPENWQQNVADGYNNFIKKAGDCLNVYAPAAKTEFEKEIKELPGEIWNFVKEAWQFISQFFGKKSENMDLPNNNG
ncbi:MAG: hypothetical protein PHG23_00035 [Candidatus Pacebacteria bacterium]|nr:hypothetical protein [Candidatus Paceibacterota bacterium]